MPYNPTGLGRPMGATAQSGLPPNRRAQRPGMSPTGPLNLAGPPKMPSAQNGVNTSRPMGMPVAPPMGMPVAPGGMTGAPPPMRSGGTPVGVSAPNFGQQLGMGVGQTNREGGGPARNDMLYDPSVAGPAFGGSVGMGGPVAPPMNSMGGSRGFILPGGQRGGGFYR